MAASRTPLFNIFWLVGERAARIGITATVFALVARHLQPEGFGQLNLAMTVTAILAALATLGLEGLVVHQLVREPHSVAATLGTAWRLRVVGSAVAVLVLGGAAGLVPAWRADFVPLVLAGISLLFTPAEVIDLCFQRHLDSRRTVLMRLLATLAGAGLRIALIAAGGGVPAFAAVLIAEGGLLAVALFWSYRRSPYAVSPWIWNSALAAQFLRRGLPLALAGLLVALSLRLDQLIVTVWLGDHAAGVYFAAAKLIEVALLTGATFSLSLFPGLSEGHGLSAAMFTERVQAQFDAMSALGWSVALGSTLLASWLIPLMYGPSYGAAAAVLVWKGWGALLALNAAARWQYILIAAPTWLNVAAALLGIGCQLALTPLLLPRWGLEGAAAAWLVSLALSGFITSFLFRPLRPIVVPQCRGLLIPFSPGRWPAMVAQFKS
ncbi:MAG TPA: flippase [Lacunisphaera sp.]|nr:flippase [Lacunisphaera sp.]